MSPEERRLLAELFERTREAASHPRDREAEALIAELVRGQPAAPYLLAQAVIVQEQALKAADEQLQDMQGYIDDLEARLQELEAQAQGARGQQGRPAGGFLGSVFGGNEPPRQQTRSAVPPSGSGSVWGSGRTLDPGPAPQQSAPWPGQRQAAPPPPPEQPQGGGFLKGALTTAAGVAGGVLLANSIKGLFGGHNDPMGMSSAKAAESGGFGAPSPGGFGSSGGSITDGVPGFGSQRRLTDAEQREQDRLQDEDQDQDMEQDEEFEDEYGGDEDAGDDE